MPFTELAFIESCGSSEGCRLEFEDPGLLYDPPGKLGESFKEADNSRALFS
jgi:hypothetical protein